MSSGSRKTGILVKARKREEGRLGDTCCSPDSEGPPGARAVQATLEQSGMQGTPAMCLAHCRQCSSSLQQLFGTCWDSYRQGQKVKLRSSRPMVLVVEVGSSPKTRGRQ